MRSVGHVRNNQGSRFSRSSSGSRLFAFSDPKIARHFSLRHHRESSSRGFARLGAVTHHGREGIATREVRVRPVAEKFTEANQRAMGWGSRYPVVERVAVRFGASKGHCQLGIGALPPSRRPAGRGTEDSSMGHRRVAMKRGCPQRKFGDQKSARPRNTGQPFGATSYCRQALVFVSGRAKIIRPERAACWIALPTLEHTLPVYARNVRLVTRAHRFAK